MVVAEGLSSDGDVSSGLSSGPSVVLSSIAASRLGFESVAMNEWNVDHVLEALEKHGIKSTIRDKFEENVRGWYCLLSKHIRLVLCFADTVFFLPFSFLFLPPFIFLLFFHLPYPHTGY
jgi:hypothetical protein